MKIYIRAYWYGEDESADDFIYGRTPRPYTEDSNEPEEYFDDEPYEVGLGYGDFDDYDSYGYSEYEDFYNEIKKRKIYVPVRVSRDIPDYNAYRKSLFGTLYLSLKSGESIEALYNVLCRTFPGIVKSGYVNDSDMLLEIADAVLYAQSVLKQ